MRKNVSRWVWVTLVMVLSVVEAAQAQNRRTVTMSRQVENEQTLGGERPVRGGPFLGRPGRGRSPLPHADRVR